MSDRATDINRKDCLTHWLIAFQQRQLGNVDRTLRSVSAALSLHHDLAASQHEMFMFVNCSAEFAKFCCDEIEKLNKKLGTGTYRNGTLIQRPDMPKIG